MRPSGSGRREVGSDPAIIERWSRFQLVAAAESEKTEGREKEIERESGNERTTTSFSKQEEVEAASISCGADEVSKDVTGSFFIVKVSVQTVLNFNLSRIRAHTLYELLSVTSYVHTHTHIPY